MRKALSWGGAMLAVLGVVFVGEELASHWRDLDGTNVSVSGVVQVGVLAAVYGGANVLLAWAWWEILRYLRANVPRLTAIRIYGVSQLAKYVPGNLFQFAGRQALGVAEGIPGAVLGKSIFAELVLISVAGAVIGALATQKLTPTAPWSYGSFVFVGLAIVVAYIVRRAVGAPIARAFICYVLFLSVSALVFVGALIVSDPSTMVSWSDMPSLCGVYVIAWLIGLITPGAPAGIGVRELVVLSLLGNEFAGGDLAIAIVITRIATVIGDTVFAGVAWCIKVPSVDSVQKRAG